MSKTNIAASGMGIVEASYRGHSVPWTFYTNYGMPGTVLLFLGDNCDMHVTVREIVLADAVMTRLEADIMLSELDDLWLRLRRLTGVADHVRG